MNRAGAILTLAGLVFLGSLDGVDASHDRDRGTASHVGPGFPSSYLALPEGPGSTVRICGPADCVTMTSTDAGPDLAMQRRNRVADLSLATFRRVCGCDPSRGLVRVTVTRLHEPVPTLPATSTLGTMDGAGPSCEPNRLTAPDRRARPSLVGRLRWRA